MKTFLERLDEARDDYETAHVSIFNDGVVRMDKKYTAKRIKDATNQSEYWAIEDVLLNTAKALIHIGEFDSIDMDLILGLIYDKRALDDETNFGKTQPIQGIVRYYTGDVNCDIKDAPESLKESAHSTPGRQGYIDYNFLLDSVKKSGLEFIGPKSFEEFEEAILAGGPFDIKIAAKLNGKGKTDNKPVTK